MAQHLSSGRPFHCACLAWVLLVSACVTAATPRLSDRHVLQLADSELRLRLGHFYDPRSFGQPYVHYSAEKRIWDVTFGTPKVRFGDVRVEIDDKTGKASVWMP